MDTPQTPQAVMGRPTKYESRYNDELVKFFSVPKNKQYVKKEKIVTKSNGTTETEREYGWMAEDLPTLDKFARSIGVDGATLYRWANARHRDNDKVPVELRGKLKRPDFCNSYNAAKILQREFLTDNALKGLYPPASFIFVAKNVTDMRDQVQSTVDLTSKGEKVTSVVGFNYLPPQKQDAPDNTNDSTNK